MSETRAAYRYALAFIGVADEFKQLDAVSKDIEQITNLLKGSKEFRLFIKSPVIRTEKKKSAVTEMFKGKISDATYHFISLLVAKNRESILPVILKQFNRLQDERLGIINANVRVAVPLAPEQERSMIAHIEAVTKKKVRLTTTIDPAVIGGLALRFDDTVWDGSIRHQLETLRHRFVKGIA